MYRYEYLKEECKKCKRCDKWIETDLLVYKGIYFHSYCFENLQKSLSPSFFDFSNAASGFRIRKPFS